MNQRIVKAELWCRKHKLWIITAAVAEVIYVLWNVL